MADKSIGDLPAVSSLNNDSLIPVEQQGVASKLTGKLFADFARESVSYQVESAKESAVSASAAVRDATAQASAAKESREQAEMARNAIENMTVNAETLEPGSPATAVKTSTNTHFDIRFGIPMGRQGETGPQGPQGAQGPAGPPGPSGAAVEATEGAYVFAVEGVDLYLYYTGDSVPDFGIDDPTGQLYVDIEE